VNVILFGAGDVCDLFIKRMPKSVLVLAIADNNEVLHGDFKSGIPIISPCDIHLYKPDYIMISCLKRHVSDIVSQLRALGLEHLYLPFSCFDESEFKDVKRPDKNGLIGGAVVSEIMDLKNIPGSVFYHISLANNFDKNRKKYLSNLENRYLHIGSGHSLGVEIYSLLRWGGEWTAIEPFPSLGENYPFHEHVAMVKQLTDVFDMPTHADNEIVFNCSSELNATSCGYGRPKLNYFPGVMLENFNDVESYDVCYSCAVMEHVVDIPSFIAKTYSLLREGGYAFHWIDLRDHRDFSKPLDFLRIGKSDWHEKYCESGHFLHGNQLRYSDYKKMFLQYGFNIVDESVYMKNPYDYIHDVSSELADEYASLAWDDLEVAGVLFVLEKPIL